MVDRTVLAAVDALPDEFRESIILKDMHGLSCGEIAELLQVPEGTVKSRLHRGRRILHQVLRPYAIEIGFIDAGPEGPS
jgi:RNA polymerase sigma-70 factor (ECF subfamily)